MRTQFNYFAVLAIGLAVSGITDAASFNCRYAKKPAEVAICQNSYLSELDEQMSSLFYDLPRHVRKNLRRSQNRWLHQRNRCGYNEECIGRAYRRRIDTLSSY
ncbi:hypothetical protein TI03_00445 [Achromatium sp. WMS1]|nr:hypothetical protein TI03_00445 [Achromatium sp. WMS1]